MPTNSLLTPAIITKETLVVLQNNLVMAAKVNRKFENQFVKIGSTLTIRKPNRYTVSTGPGLQIQNITEPSTSITISNQTHVDFQFSNADLTLTIEEFSERYLMPAAEALASNLDFGVMSNFQQVQNAVGTLGTPANNYSFITAVGQRMDEGGVPQSGRVVTLDPATYWALNNALSTLFVRSAAEPALKGFLANIANMEFYLSQNVQAQTFGNFAGTGVVNGAGQIGAQILTNGWTPNLTLFNVGDNITFGGVNAINPQNRTSTGSLQNFVVTATATSDASGNSTISIYPSITTSGAYQTVSGSPANLATVRPAVTSMTAGAQYFNNLAFVQDAFGLVTVPLEVPQGVDFAAQEEWKGLSMTVIRVFDITNYVFPCRIDMLWGTSVYYPELAVRQVH